MLGGIKLKDILQAVRVVGEAANIPQLKSEEFADFSESVEELEEVAKKILESFELISDLVNSSNRNSPDNNLSGLTSILKLLPWFNSNGVLSSFGDEAVLVGQLIGFLENGNDDELTVPGVFHELKESLRHNYKNDPEELSYAIFELNQIMDVSDVLSSVKSKPKRLVADLLRFSPLDALAQKDRLQAIRDIFVQDLESVLEPNGPLFSEIDLLLNGYGVGVDGARGVFSNLLAEFFEHVEEAINGVLEEFATLIEEEKIQRLWDFFDVQYPAAIYEDEATDPTGRVLASKALLNLEAYEDFLRRDIKNKIIGGGTRILYEIGEQLNETEWFPGDEVFGPLDKKLEPVRENLRGFLTEVKKLISKFPRNVSIKYDFESELTSGPKGFEIFRGLTPEGKRAKLVFHSRIDKKLGLTSETNLSEPTIYSLIKITDFQIVLIPGPEFISITFNELKVETTGIKKTAVAVDIGDVEFGDSLEFINELTEFFSPDNGFDFDVSRSGISAKYQFGVPDFTVGVFNLADLSLGVGVTLPFDGSPIGIAFNVSEQHRPCLVSIGIFGGTAFFRMLLEPSDSGISIREMEASLEFGAVVQADLGVAKGQLYVFGGLYYGRLGNDVVFKGYIRAGGNLSVLGLITVSAEFYLGLSYQRKRIEAPPGAKASYQTYAYGVARVTYRVKILFVINTSATVEFKKEFLGSVIDEPSVDSETEESLLSRRSSVGLLSNAEDPSPEKPNSHVPIDPRQWNSYCELFA